MNGLDPNLLFEAARRFDKTSPCPKMVEDSDSPLDGVGKALGRKEAPGNTFYLGSGAQLANHRPALVNNKRAAVIRLEHLDHWNDNLPEVTRILHAFLTEARERPAMLWSHTVCWTDRAIQRHAKNVFVGDINPRLPEERSYGDVVALHFEPNGKRTVTVRTDALDWRRADGIPDSRKPLLKTAKSRIYRERARGKRVVGGSYGEELGASSDDWRDDDQVAEYGRLPGLRDLTYGLDVSPLGESRLLSQGQKCLDPTGILDVFLLKASRLFKRPQTDALDDIRIEQLEFAFDREGLVAYIAASSRRFEEFSVESRWGAHFFDWAQRNGPRGKSC